MKNVRGILERPKCGKCLRALWVSGGLGDKGEVKRGLSVLPLFYTRMEQVFTALCTSGVWQRTATKANNSPAHAAAHRLLPQCRRA